MMMCQAASSVSLPGWFLAQAATARPGGVGADRMARRPSDRVNRNRRPLSGRIRALFKRIRSHHFCRLKASFPKFSAYSVRPTA
eukprot:392736-Hanusia_phi.AAC.2